MNTALEQAIESAGGVGKLAASIGATQSQVSNWRARGTLPDAVYCVRIERLYGIPRKAQRPADWFDIWPELQETSDA